MGIILLVWMFSVLSAVNDHAVVGQRHDSCVDLGMKLLLVHCLKHRGFA
jgi:hypothetical protein